MSSGIYNRMKSNLLSGLFDANGSGSHSIKVALLDSNHSFVADNNAWAAVSANEVSGTGYTTGGATLANSVVTQDDTNDWGKWDADDVVWSNSTITARYAVLYDNTLIDNDLICCFDFGSDQSSSSGNFTIQWNSNGIVTLS